MFGAGFRVCRPQTLDPKKQNLKRTKLNGSWVSYGVSRFIRPKSLTLKPKLEILNPKPDLFRCCDPSSTQIIPFRSTPKALRTEAGS